MGSGAVSKRCALPFAVTQLECSTAHLSWHSTECVGAVDIQHLLANPISQTTEVISGLALGHERDI